MIKKFPELRQFFFARYFYDKSQAWLLLGALGLLVAAWTPLGLVLGAPYVISRALEPSQTLRGVLRPVRVLAYLAKDVLSFVLLAAGSLRFRRLLL